MGIGAERILKEEAFGEWLTSYDFKNKAHKLLLTPGVEFSRYFGIEIPVHFSSQNLSYSIGNDWRYSGNPYWAYPNKYATVVNNRYSTRYNCLGYGIMPYASLGKKVRLKIGVGFYTDHCSFTNKRVIGSIDRFHFDSTATFVQDSYTEYDSLQGNERLRNDYFIQFQFALQFVVGKCLKVQPALVYRKSTGVNSLSVSEKNSWGISLSLFFSFSFKKEKGEFRK